MKKENKPKEPAHTGAVYWVPFTGCSAGGEADLVVCMVSVFSVSPGFRPSCQFCHHHLRDLDPGKTKVR